LRLSEFSRLNLEQWCSRLDSIAELGEQLDDPPGVLGRHRRGHIVVDRDIAFRHLFGTKAHEANRLDLEPSPLSLAGLKVPRASSDGAGWVRLAGSATFFPITTQRLQHQRIGRGSQSVHAVLFLDRHHTTLGFGDVRPATLRRRNHQSVARRS